MRNDHTYREFKAIGIDLNNLDQLDELTQFRVNLTTKLLDTLDTQGHSGFSINYIVQYFTTIALHQKLVEDDYPVPLSVVEHGKNELTKIGYDLTQTEEDPDKWICENTLELLQILEDSDKLIYSLPVDSYREIIEWFATLAKQQPLCPLTGNDEEWNDVSEYGGSTSFQNNRLSSVFKNEHGVCYDLNGICFRDNPEHGYYTNRFSCKLIEFPYTPTPIIRLDVPEECSDEQYIELINNIENYKPYLKEWING